MKGAARTMMIYQQFLTIATAATCALGAAIVYAQPSGGDFEDAIAAAQDAPLAIHATNPAEVALLQMQTAFAKGDTARLGQLLPLTATHPLHGWGAYWELSARLKNAAPEQVDAFLTKWAGTYWEDRLRNDWLLLLGQRRQWAEFERLHPAFRMRDDRQVQCYALAIDVIEGRAASNAAATLAPLWFAQPNNDDGCAHAAATLHAVGHLPAEIAWERARRSAHQGGQNGARQALALVAPELLSAASAAIANPEKFLQPPAAKKGAARTASPAIDPRLAALALTRLAVSKPERVVALMHSSWGAQLGAADADWVWGAATQALAMKRESAAAASAWGQVRQPAALHPDMLAWAARAQLRLARWAAVRSTIEAMDEATRAQPMWTYWLAHSLARAPRADNRGADKAWSQQLLERVAVHVGDFYGQLALADLGRPLTAPPEPPAPTPAELAAAAANPGLQRALQAITIGLRREGVREWNYTTNLHTPGGMDDRALLAAAALACRFEVWDRCINTSERTRSFASWSQRYPTPLIEAMRPKAAAQALDLAFVYGLVRQESRFILDARSHVGATGLMQVMPATARWTAKKIGLSGFVPAQLADQDTNLTIGAAYLRLVLDDFEGSMPLAAAGYNAGPGRPRLWRQGPKLDAAIWAENIPFTETRDYVKKVLANATAYAVRIEGQPQSLRTRLGHTIGPATKAATPDLP